MDQVFARWRQLETKKIRASNPRIEETVRANQKREFEGLRRRYLETKRAKTDNHQNHQQQHHNNKETKISSAPRNSGGLKPKFPHLPQTTTTTITPSAASGSGGLRQNSHGQLNSQGEKMMTSSASSVSSTTATANANCDLFRNLPEFSDEFLTEFFKNCPTTSQILDEKITSAALHDIFGSAPNDSPGTTPVQYSAAPVCNSAAPNCNYSNPTQPPPPDSQVQSYRQQSASAVFPPTSTHTLCQPIIRNTAIIYGQTPQNLATCQMAAYGTNLNNTNPYPLPQPSPQNQPQSAPVRFYVTGTSSTMGYGNHVTYNSNNGSDSVVNQGYVISGGFFPQHQQQQPRTMYQQPFQSQQQQYANFFHTRPPRYPYT